MSRPHLLVCHGGECSPGAALVMVTRTRSPDHLVEAECHGQSAIMREEANYRDAGILETSAFEHQIGDG